MRAPELAVETRAPNDPAWLFYTSGTTGRPKGATLTHRNLLAMSFCYVADVDPGSPSGAILHAAPMSHGSGLYAVPNVMSAACHVIPESGGFDPAEIYELIRCYPDISFFAAPTMVKRLLDHPGDEDTRNLKTIMYGGGPMSVEDSRAALERFGPRLAQLYGQGESPMTITSLGRSIHADRDHPRWLASLASVGVAQSVVEVRVADEDDRTLPVGQIGEVLVRDDSVMRGYRKDPDATSRTLRNGWLHTGDVGTLDDEGFLTLKDRSKDSHHLGRHQHLSERGRGSTRPAPGDRRGLGHWPGGQGMERGGRGVCGQTRKRCARRRRTRYVLPGANDALQAPQALSLHLTAPEERIRQGAEDRASRAGGGSAPSRCRLDAPRITIGPSLLRSGRRRLARPLFAQGLAVDRGAAKIDVGDAPRIRDVVEGVGVQDNKVRALAR